MRKFIFMCGFLVAFASAGLAQQKRVLDRIIAVVDDKIILQSELDQLAINLAMQAKVEPEFGTEAFEDIRKRTLEQLVVQKLLFVKAKEDSVVVDDSRIERALEENVSAMVQQFGSESKVEEYFGTTLRKVKKNLRKNIHERMLVEALQQQRVFQIPISRREILEFYRTKKDSIPKRQESVDISHILVGVKAGSEVRDRAYARILAAKKEIDEGAEFTEVAKKYGEDGTAPLGGEIGFMAKADLVPEYAEEAWRLKVGEVSDVVETQFGFHLIQPIEKRGDKVNSRHILVRMQVTEDDEQRTVAFLDSLVGALSRNEMDFADAARQYSEDASSKDKGGALGWFELDQLQLAEWRDAARALRVGEVSRPIKTNFGYIIVRLNEKKDARELDIDSDWEDISAIALNYKREKEFLRWVDSIKEDVYIKTYL